MFDPFAAPDFPEVPEPVYDEPVRKQRCSHAQDAVQLPSGVVVYASSSWTPRLFIPHFVLALAPEAMSSAAATLHVPWADHGLPMCDWNIAEACIKAAYGLAASGYRIEVGCYAGHGRTATALCCMVRMDTDTQDPFQWVAEHYCPRAIADMTPAQQNYIMGFGDDDLD